ncbi:hypothetical protein GCM10010916_40890 [Paenibacillus abyssi]|uniref:Uncharacterized protein n=1 Tax=Paenibacillus abyssi TaxID=1340531 RepID=A0A917G2I5_9BACL|nr:hypothetical protein GCM10010916_40890 [Paenibacillus abyssi]
MDEQTSRRTNGEQDRMIGIPIDVVVSSRLRVAGVNRKSGSVIRSGMWVVPREYNLSSLA